MKTFMERLGCLALLGLVAGCGASMGKGLGASPETRMNGTWKGADQFGQEMELTLKDDESVTLRITGVRDSFYKRGTYAIDTSHSPPHFNIKLADRDEIQTICELIDEDHLAFESINSSDPRPTEFGPNQIVLERQ